MGWGRGRSMHLQKTEKNHRGGLRLHLAMQGTWVPSLCCAQSLSRVQLCNPWAVAQQAPLSMGILQSRTLKWAAVPSLGLIPGPRLNSCGTWTRLL